MYREICQTNLSEFHPTVWEKSRECQRNTYHYAVWQLLLYFYSEFPSKILSVYTLGIHEKKKNLISFSHFLYTKVVVKHKSSKSRDNNKMADLFRKKKFREIDFSEKRPPFCYICIYEKSYDIRYSR